MTSSKKNVSGSFKHKEGLNGSQSYSDTDLGGDRTYWEMTCRSSEEKTQNPINKMTVAAIGASAGGLEALQQFFLHLPPTPAGIAFVIIYHLDPTHSDCLIELLKKYTALEVLSIEHDMMLAENKVFLIPPNAYVALEGLSFRLAKSAEKRLSQRPVDYFFQSMAQEVQEGGIGIILSGAGTDGALGLRAIKENGGSVWVQDPATAQFDSMPRKAIVTGLADIVLSPQQLALKLSTLIRRSELRKNEERYAVKQKEPLENLCALLQSRTGHLFQDYRAEAVFFCLQQRLHARHFNNYADYWQFLQTDSDEAELLTAELISHKAVFIESPLKPKEANRSLTLGDEIGSATMAILAQDVLIREYAPPAVIINNQCDVLYYHGSLSRYLTIPPGKPTHRLIDVIRPELKNSLKRMLRAIMKKTDAVRFSVPLNDENANSGVVLLVKHVAERELIVIGFYKADANRAATDVLSMPMPAVPILIEPINDEFIRLENELKNTKAELSETLEASRLSDAELRMANEEILSMNEELQSANEELEASREELQSLNEELSIANSDLQDKVMALQAVTNDITNLFNAINIATVFLDKNMRVRRFTPASSQLFRLIASDIGRPLADITQLFDDSHLLEQAACVAALLNPIEKTIKSYQGRYYLCRILPYITHNHFIDGVILTFIDITDIRAAYASLRERQAQLQLFIEHAPVALAMFDCNMNYLAVSRRWLADYNLKASVIIGRNHYDIYPDISERWKNLFRRGISGKVLACAEDRIRQADGSEQWLNWKLHPWYKDDKSVGGLIFFTENITERKHMMLQLSESENRFRSFMDHSPAIASIKNEEGHYIYVNQTFEKRFKICSADIIGKSDFEVWPYVIASQFRHNDSSILQREQFQEIVEEILEPNKSRSYWRTLKFPIANSKGRYIGSLGLDITESRRIEARLAQVQLEMQEDRDILQAVMDGSPNYHLAYLDRYFNFVRVNQAFAENRGFKPGDLIGKNYFELFPDPQNEKFFVHVRDHLKVFEAHDRPFWFPNQPERGLTYWDWMLTPVLSAAQKLDGLVLSLHETTARKLAEDKLILAAQVFEKSGEGILIMDEQTRIITVNSAFTAITGYLPEEVAGKKPSFKTCGCRLKKYYRQIRQAIMTKGWWQGEMESLRKDGEIYTEWMTLNAVYDHAERLINFVAIFSDISILKSTQQRIEFLATHDELTQLPNRRLFMDRIKQTIAHARRNNSSFSVLFVDLDNFKVINDSLGHEAGDLLLQEIAKRLQECLRMSDTIARFGGDEFTLIIEEADEQQAALMASRISNCLAAPVKLKEQTLYISASIGISQYPDDGDDPETLLKHSDGAMYQAKESGKATHQFFSKEVRDAADERLFLESGLRDAVERDELFLLYQPQFSLVSGELVGLESLVRWRHSSQGVISPTRFIPLAEKTGLIDLIGNWTANAACRQVMEWLEQGFAIPTVSINISIEQLKRANIVKLFKRLFGFYRIPPEKITLELTESALMVNPLRARQLLNELKDLGVLLSIDDFGTGYSSLAYLRRFRLDELKIDRTFVDEIVDNPDDRAIAQTIIAMAQILGLSVVAEGIETTEQLAILQNLGCSIGQGYFLAEPMTPSQIRDKYFS